MKHHEMFSNLSGQSRENAEKAYRESLAMKRVNDLELESLEEDGTVVPSFEVEVRRGPGDYIPGIVRLEFTDTSGKQREDLVERHRKRIPELKLEVAGLEAPDTQSEIPILRVERGRAIPLDRDGSIFVKPRDVLVSIVDRGMGPKLDVEHAPRRPKQKKTAPDHTGSGNSVRKNPFDFRIGS